MTDFEFHSSLLSKDGKMPFCDISSSGFRVIDLTKEDNPFNLDVEAGSDPTILFSSKKGYTSYWGSEVDDIIHIQGNGDFDPDYGANKIFLYESDEPLTESSRTILIPTLSKEDSRNELNFSNIKDVKSIEDLVFTYRENVNGFVIMKEDSRAIIATVCLQEEMDKVEVQTDVKILMAVCEMTFDQESASYMVLDYSCVGSQYEDSYRDDNDGGPSAYCYRNDDSGWMI